jgi:hypothetical protein
VWGYAPFPQMADSAVTDLSFELVITTPPVPEDEAASFFEQGDGHLGAKALPIQRRNMSTGTKQPPIMPPTIAPTLLEEEGGDEIT